MPSNITMTTLYGGVSVTDRRWKPADVAAAPTAAEFAVTQDIRNMDAALVGNNPSYWTATRLAQESWWDKLFAIRNLQANSAGLA